MGRSRSRTPSRKSSRSKHHSKKSRHRTPERKSSKYRHRSVSSSDSSSNRYKSSSSKYHSKRRRHDSKSPTSHRGRSGRRHRRSSSSSSHSSSSSSSRSKDSRSSHSDRSSSSEKRRNKPSSSYMDKIRSMRTPTPPVGPKLNFDASMEFLDKRHVSDSLADINADEFRPKAFSSNVKTGKSEADIIKIKGETRPIKVDSNDDPLFHQKVFGGDDARMEQWVHRVYTYRQKMFATTN